MSSSTKDKITSFFGLTCWSEMKHLQLGISLPQALKKENRLLRTLLLLQKEKADAWGKKSPYFLIRDLQQHDLWKIQTLTDSSMPCFSV